MALSSSTVFEVQSGGSDNNGGGFISGASGTDYSQSTTPHVAIDNSSITATATNTTPSTMTLTGYTVATGDVGNLVTLTGGTNIVSGTYSIASVNTGTNKWTLDRNCCSGGAGSAITGNMGGAFATPGKALGLMAKAGMVTYIKSATYQITANLTNTAILTNGFSRIIGYNSTRGDGGRATIQANANNFDMVTVNGGATAIITLENIVIDGNSNSGINGLRVSDCVVVNCIIKNCTDAHAVYASNSTIFNSEIGPNAFTHSALNSVAAVTSGADAINVDSCYIHDNSSADTMYDAAAVSVGKASSVSNCIVYNNTGSLMHGIIISGSVRNCVVHANGLNGIYVGYGDLCLLTNNIITDNGGYGISFTNPFGTVVCVRNNAYYGNTSGETYNMTTGGGDVTLSGLPYVNAPTDFSLNNTSGEGLACKGAGTPGTIGLSSTVGTGYLDIGPLQRIGPAPGGNVTTAYTFVS